MNIGSVIMNKRKALGYTQQALADQLNVSFQVKRRKKSFLTAIAAESRISIVWIL